MNVDLEASSLWLDIDLDGTIAIVTLRWVTFNFVSLIELT
jgi:hypothetical protein